MMKVSKIIQIKQDKIDRKENAVDSSKGSVVIILFKTMINLTISYAQFLVVDIDKERHTFSKLNMLL